MIDNMSAIERRAVAWRVAAAVGNVQDVVWEMVSLYDARTKAKRAEVRACEEATWQDVREERARHVTQVRADAQHAA